MDEITDLTPDSTDPEIGPVDQQGAVSPIIWVVGTLIVVALVVAAAVGGYWYATRGTKTVPEPTFSPAPEPTAPGVACTLEAKLCPDGSSVGRTGPNCEFSPCPNAATPTPSPDPFASWKTYSNDQYGFSIMYPAEYKVLTDKDSLSGWPNAVALIYNGGQAYDIAIQAWDSEEDYQLAYPQAGTELVVYQIKGKFVTVVDSTREPNNQAVMTTFEKLTQ